jgi:[ribosomal protein S5]-alanine N-acetyltransferase
VTEVAANNFPTLLTNRLKLRAVAPVDGAPFFALMSIPEVTRYSNWPDSPTEDQVKEFIRNMSELFAAGSGCAWIIEELSSSAFIGAIRFNYFQKAWKVGGVGYEAHPSYWGRGLMTEALGAVVACGHAFFELNRIEAWTLMGNGASDASSKRQDFDSRASRVRRAISKGRFTIFACSVELPTIRRFETSWTKLKC